MTSDAKSNGAGDGHGLESHKVTVVSVKYDHDTCLVSFEAHGAPMGLMQMMVDELRRQLDIMRRQAAAIEFSKAQNEARANAALAESIFGTGGKRP